MSEKKRISLFRYWTTRYLITLCIGLLVIGIASSYWINYSEKQKRLDFMRLMAAEVSDRVVDANGRVITAPFLFRLLDSRQESLRVNYKPFMVILDADHRAVFGGPGPFSSELRRMARDLVATDESMSQVELDRGEKLLFVKKSIQVNQQTVGWVMLFTPMQDLTRSTTEFQLLFTMLISLGLLGWLVIYLLTKKLSTPIKEVADAAKQIVMGNYDIHLEKDRREDEIYELIHSFKEMADRLRQLELMRTELLAGVTHELKTPVTSISGLVQAVKDDIVGGEEAKEFLEICSKETVRLQKMVEDLLDFNSFAVGDIRIRREQQNMYELVQEITHQWQIVQEVEQIELSIVKPEEPIIASTDPLRVQQILYNLLNNAAQAMDSAGKIVVSLSRTGDEIRIDVKDTGSGIPEAEQPLIFERFYRGEEKKHLVRGLGLGLSFSKMIAQALGGKLLLSESSRAGSTFTLLLRA
ncbi:HAMP domain-containing sensor histidine kinase [Brevibacillus agri]|uniref:HAMP domain-containing sensor histidine kinase n=1 Tax=Brevibacillus TaxID=55080 RepID=UPI00030A2B14|nr:MULTISPECIES: HAMP domain-containing sensor histidine kinase [Brevibacillus]MBY0054383.1 HAMP domain-containing histidine kinase [Brevibacillus agri]MED1644191.1 HAMP domain-containing sensor histidine kinase [Brevibacillus agri]MED1655459.1 HAMP domain-containing sensor histidine kinase [Brevibacillus agri]MED1687401.1 HAMP domain-containing sensor histidine kinase [Brevibacillus agri]MED1692032.1 HAMP domain-containing sensor histidine kinase [Brevibacillus agri]